MGDKALDLEGRAGAAVPAPLVAQTILAIDHGTKRIGLAIKPSGRSVAMPLGVLEIGSTQRVMDRIHQTILERGVGIVVSGRIGSLEPKKDANILVFDGDPLDIQSRLTRVMVEGMFVYESE